jgi:hypothetical protein
VAIIALCVIVMAVRKIRVRSLHDRLQLSGHYCVVCYCNGCPKISRKKFARQIETYTFGQDWEELCGTEKCDFHNYVSVERNVATSGVSTFEELCAAYASTRSVEEMNKED